MKKVVVFLILTLVLSSCNEYKKIIPDIAKVKIKLYFLDGDRLDTENRFIEIIDDNEIKQIVKWITGVRSPAYKCGYNGGIEFYCKKNNLLMEAEFNTDCNTIVFVYNDKLYTRRISKAGLEYLKKITVM